MILLAYYALKKYNTHTMLCSNEKAGNWYEEKMGKRSDYRSGYDFYYTDYSFYSEISEG